MLTCLKIFLFRELLTITLVLITRQYWENGVSSQVKEKVTEDYKDQGKCLPTYCNQMASRQRLRLDNVSFPIREAIFTQRPF